MTGSIIRVAIWLSLFLTPEGSCRAQTHSWTDSVEVDGPARYTDGLLEVMSNGQVNAAARFIRLNIGEAGKFVIPISLYSSVSANHFRDQWNPVDQRSNEHLAYAFLNPLSGWLSVSTEGMVQLNRERSITRVGFLYFICGRMLSAFRVGDPADPRTGSPVNFLNNFLSAGFIFQTGAWTLPRQARAEEGTFWTAVEVHTAYSHPDVLKKVLQEARPRGMYAGYSIGMGITINGSIRVKVVYHHYTHPPEIEYAKPIYQLALNFRD